MRARAEGARGGCAPARGPSARPTKRRNRERSIGRRDEDDSSGPRNRPWFPWVRDYGRTTQRASSSLRCGARPWRRPRSPSPPPRERWVERRGLRRRSRSSPRPLPRARAFASDVWVKPRSAPRSASPPPPEGSAPPRVTTAYSLTALEAELRRAFPPGGPGALPHSDDPAHRAPLLPAPSIRGLRRRGQAEPRQGRAQPRRAHPDHRPRRQRRGPPPPLRRRGRRRGRARANRGAEARAHGSDHRPRGRRHRRGPRPRRGELPPRRRRRLRRTPPRRTLPRRRRPLVVVPTLGPTPRDDVRLPGRVRVLAGGAHVLQPRRPGEPREARENPPGPRPPEVARRPAQRLEPPSLNPDPIQVRRRRREGLRARLQGAARRARAS